MCGSLRSGTFDCVLWEANWSTGTVGRLSVGATTCKDCMTGQRAARLEKGAASGGASLARAGAGRPTSRAPWQQGG
jgi:hypothetical protein